MFTIKCILVVLKFMSNAVNSWCFRSLYICRLSNEYLLYINKTFEHIVHLCRFFTWVPNNGNKMRVQRKELVLFPRGVTNIKTLSLILLLKVSPQLSSGIALGREKKV